MRIEDSPFHEFLDIIAIDYHRNGRSGAGFHVVLFDDEDGRKVGIVFEALGHCAVLDVKKLATGDVAFGSNSWRGDNYEFDLWRAIREWDAARAPGRRVRNGHHQEGPPGFLETLAVTPWKACRRLFADVGRFLACKG